MPGFDRTGPNGQEPGTGCGMGGCQPQESTNRPMRGGKGRCMGRHGFGGQGFAVGGGRGIGMRNRFFAQNSQVADNVKTEDIDELYNNVETLKKQVAELGSRLAKAETDKNQNT